MKTINKPLEALILAILVAPFIYAALVWNQLPAEIVSHYDFQGRANDTQAKETFTLFMAGLQAFVYGLLRYVPGAGVFSNIQTTNYQRLRLAVTLFLSGLMAWMVYSATQPKGAQNPLLILLMVFGLLAAIGNYMTTLRPNFFVGIRTPWTLFNETVWRKTHQMTGRLWVGGSVLGAVLMFLVPTDWQMGLLLTIVGILTMVPIVYSYVVFRQEKQRIA